MSAAAEALIAEVMRLAPVTRQGAIELLRIVVAAELTRRQGL